ncbi:MAG: ABC transporter ATP-binding protein [Sneathiella sp.]|nr:MAG: ABC transporter ATP-binding protein [Sneathiella sp.]
MNSDSSSSPSPWEPSAVGAVNQAAPAVGVSLQLDRLSFDDTIILEDFGLSLPAGQITCLLGPSGVGKSSILKLLAGFIPLPAKSAITCDDGHGITNRASYMDQQDLLLPWASSLENVVIGARLRGEIPDLTRARKLLTEVGLQASSEALPNTLSGGMRQRVALARTLMDDSPIVLMDEPFSALDAITRFRLQDLAARLLKGKTVLLITHDPMEALRLGHVIHVMSGTPVSLSPPLRPEGALPRDPASDALKHHYSEIMANLALSEPAYA